MAKRKTPKTEKVIDLTPKPEKISEEHLGKVQNTINSINQHQMELGVMETRKHNILHNLAGIQDQLTVLQEEFQKDYGTIDINIQDGTINYPPEPGINPVEFSKENGETNKED